MLLFSLQVITCLMIYPFQHIFLSICCYNYSKNELYISVLVRNGSSIQYIINKCWFIHACQIGNALKGSQAQFFLLKQLYATSVLYGLCMLCVKLNISGVYMQKLSDNMIFLTILPCHFIDRMIQHCRKIRILWQMFSNIIV